ncbi:MAG: hypothetical protein HY692_05370 [Cyanobacteria bacterium NC_groundwater_1444_Ag_S-0.65um_54_12]|nr:hypothetical protein [Cyanobacteria bacterium NC_groundwater_1444_Ag_S-0.65um_54_12]
MKLPLQKTLFGLVLLLTILPLVPEPLERAIAAGNTGGVDWSAGMIAVVGEGVAPPEGNAAKRRLLAKRAAMVDGYRKLAELVEGVEVTSQTRVKDFEVQSDDIRTQVAGLIKGARLAGENLTADGAYEVRLELPLFGEQSLAAVVLSSSLNNRQLPSPDSPGSSGMITGQTPHSPGKTKIGAVDQVTGILVDARQLGASAAMMPALFDEKGNEFYLGSWPANQEDLIAQGVVAYSRSLEEASKLPRLGSAPLVVRAKRYRGPFHADLVFSQEEAKRFQEAGKACDCLQRLAVAIVL